MTQPSGLDISPAKSSDVPLILCLINELADYEKLRHESVATEASIEKALFGPKPGAEAVIARFTKSLLSHLAALALERDCGRFQWQVLDWNRPSRDFYERLGAQADAAWVNYRMTGDALQRLADSCKS